MQPVSAIISESTSTVMHHNSLKYCILLALNSIFFVGSLAAAPTAEAGKTIFQNQNQQSIYFCGTNHTVYIDIEGNIFTTGKNKHGQLGLGDTANRHSRERIKSIPLISTENKVKKVILKKE